MSKGASTMNEYRQNGRNYVGYEYKEITVDRDKVSLYIDAYQSFGWQLDENVQPESILGRISVSPSGLSSKVSIKLKRDRRIINKAELTRLQRHFEDCMNQIDDLERSKTSFATMVAIIIGVIGTAFVAGSVFAVTAEPPIIWLCILLAIPGAIGCALPYHVHKSMVRKKTASASLLIEEKYDEIYEICEKGSSLL